MAVDKLVLNSGIKPELALYMFPVWGVAWLHLLEVGNPYGAIGLPGIEIFKQTMIMQLLAFLGVPILLFLMGWIAALATSVVWPVNLFNAV